jgi:hypothetical protein
LRQRARWASDPAFRERFNARERAKRENPEFRIRKLAGQARGRAKARGLPFDDDISDLLPPPTHCPALGIPLDYSMGRGQCMSSPSIDRIDNTKGYVKGNRVVVSMLANTRKSDLSVADLRRMADFYESQRAGEDAR